MNVDRDVQAAGELDGVIAAGIVDQDQLVGNPRRDVGNGLLQRLLRPVGGHGYHDFGHGRSSAAPSGAAPSYRR